MKNKEFDLQYSDDGFFIRFIPLTKAGDTAWLEIAKQTEGTGKIYTHHLTSTLAQLRAAGYSVKKANKPSQGVKQAALDDALLSDLLI